MASKAAFVCAAMGFFSKKISIDEKLRSMRPRNTFSSVGGQTVSSMVYLVPNNCGCFSRGESDMKDEHGAMNVTVKQATNLITLWEGKSSVKAFEMMGHEIKMVQSPEL